jgi:hypothetical protein
MGEPITIATIGIYRMVAKELLPTPSKSHYLFNTRDLAKIIQASTREVIFKPNLLIHESGVHVSTAVYSL